MPSSSGCTDVQNCNWLDCSASTVDCAADCANATLSPSFCGATENGLDYVEVNSISDGNTCTNAAGCILHDKTVTVQANCVNTMRCNATCWTGSTPRACVNEAECTSSGECIGDEYLGRFVDIFIVQKQLYLNSETRKLFRDPRQIFFF